MSEDLDTLSEEIKATEQRLTELRKEYRDRRTAGLRAAMEARKEADKAVQDELKALGYARYNMPKFTDYSLYW